MKLFLVSAVAAGLFLGLLSAPASAAAVGCGAAISHSVKLTKDITDCAANPALTITDNGVTLNLNGHTVDGTGGGIGIAVPSATATKIINGKVHDFNTGVYITSSTDTTVSKLRFSSTAFAVDTESSSNDKIVRNRFIVPGGGTGVVAGTSSNGLVLRNTFSDNLAVNLVSATTSFTVRNNKITGGAITTTASVSGVVVQGNKIDTGRIEVDGQNIRIEANHVGHSPLDGIVLDSAALGVQVIGNTSSSNVGDGIHVIPNDPATSIGQNTTNDNQQYGIDAQPLNDDAGGNRAHGNGVFIQCLNIACSSA